MDSVRSLSLSIFLGLTVSLPAFADQCSGISKQQALLAVARLNVGQTIYELCEPCGETRPKALYISSLAAQTAGSKNEYWSVAVNGKSIDLAYIFIKSGRSGQLFNLARATSCPASDVSNTLKI
jgi:hypothetical protein